LLIGLAGDDLSSSGKTARQRQGRRGSARCAGQPGVACSRSLMTGPRAGVAARYRSSPATLAPANHCARRNRRLMPAIRDRPAAGGQCARSSGFCCQSPLLIQHTYLISAASCLSFRKALYAGIEHAAGG